MTQQTRRRREFNMVRAKSLIVGIVAFFTAIGSALSGLGAQVAFTPMLTWMLGFATDKALATALRFGMVTAFAAVIGGFVAHVTPHAFVLRGVVLALSATVGAYLAAPIAGKLRSVSQRRLFQSIGVIITLFTTVQTAHLSAWDVPHYASWQGAFPLALLGFVIGALTLVLGLPSGTLLIPTLYFLAGLKAKEVVMLSLLVVALASALPVWSYARRGLSDTLYGNWAVLGGLLGGFAGGMLLASVPEKAVLYLFSVVAMFLCGRELARMI